MSVPRFRFQITRAIPWRRRWKTNEIIFFEGRIPVPHTKAAVICVDQHAGNALGGSVTWDQQNHSIPALATGSPALSALRLHGLAIQQVIYQADRTQSSRESDSIPCRTPGPESGAGRSEYPSEGSSRAPLAMGMAGLQLTAVGHRAVPYRPAPSHQRAPQADFASVGPLTRRPRK